MRTFFVFTVLMLFGPVSPAFAGGEDIEEFQADCSGFDAATQTFPRGAACRASLLNGTCYGDYESLPKGSDAYVVRKEGSRWIRVSALTHYDSCYPESENGRNSTMRFKATKSGTYAIFVDGKGDNRPAVRVTVLAVGVQPGLRSFKIRVR